MSRKKPLINEQSAVCLARVINRIAMSFDVAALSVEEVVQVHIVLERLTDALVQVHEDMLRSLYQSVTQYSSFSIDDGLGESDDESD